MPPSPPKQFAHQTSPIDCRLFAVSMCGRVAPETPNQVAASKQLPLFLCCLTSHRLPAMAFFRTHHHLHPTNHCARNNAPIANQEKHHAGSLSVFPALFPPSGQPSMDPGLKGFIHHSQLHTRATQTCPRTPADNNHASPMHNPAVVCNWCCTSNKNQREK